MLFTGMIIFRTHGMATGAHRKNGSSRFWIWRTRMYPEQWAAVLRKRSRFAEGADKMKFGCCLNMVSVCPDGTGMEWLRDLAELGYDYAELPLAQMMELDDPAFEVLRRQLKDAGIPCLACNNFFPPMLRLTGAEVDERRIMAYVERALVRAETLGVECVVFGSGPAKRVPVGFSMEEGYHQVVRLLRRVGPAARKHGITVVIEPLRQAECNLINTFAEGVHLARDTDDPNVKVLVDFYHMTVEKETVEHLLDDGCRWLHHVHFANPSGRVYPATAAEANYHPFIQTLRAIGYDRSISCEAYAPNGFRQDASVAKRFFERYL